MRLRKKMKVVPQPSATVTAKHGRLELAGDDAGSSEEWRGKGRRSGEKGGGSPAFFLYKRGRGAFGLLELGGALMICSPNLP